MYSHPYLVIVTEHGPNTDDARRHQNRATTAGHTQQHRFKDISQARTFYRAMLHNAHLYGRTVVLIDNGIEAERVDNE